MKDSCRILELELRQVFFSKFGTLSESLDSSRFPDNKVVLSQQLQGCGNAGSQQNLLIVYS